MENYTLFKKKTCSHCSLHPRVQNITHSANYHHRASGRAPLFFLPKSPWFPCRHRVSLTSTIFICHYGSNYGTCFHEEEHRFSASFMSSWPVTKARVVPTAAKLPDKEDVVILDALKLALRTYAGLSLMVTIALDIRP